MNGKPQTGRKYLPHMYDKDLQPDDLKTTCNLMVKKITQLWTKRLEQTLHKERYKNDQ